MPLSLGQFTDEFLGLFLRVVFKAEGAPKELWVGLARQSALASPKLADMAEPKMVGYKRQRLTSEDWMVDGTTALSRMVHWDNTQKDAWPPVDVYFLATSADGSGVLLDWKPLKARRELMTGDTLEFPISIQFERK